MLRNEGANFIIKDSDNFFEFSTKAENAVCYANLADVKINTAINKSYVQLADSGSVVNIVEKQIISNTFCVGGYSFKSSKEFQK